jgi:hypothetical protein
VMTAPFGLTRNGTASQPEGAVVVMPVVRKRKAKRANRWRGLSHSDGVAKNGPCRTVATFAPYTSLPKTRRPVDWNVANIPSWFPVRKEVRRP